MPRKLPDPQQALGDYLDEMLHLATTAATPQTRLEDGAKSRLPVQLIAPGALQVEAPEPRPEAAPEGRPGNAPSCTDAAAALEFPLQCLMFRVAGHLLAAPLIQLSGVVGWRASPTRLPQSPDWMLGLLQHREQQLRVADSRLLLGISAPAADAPEHLLVLGDGRWAITCDRLEQVVYLEYDDVHWKPDGAAALVLGTIRASLSTLLNPPGISASLDARGAPAAGA